MESAERGSDLAPPHGPMTLGRCCGLLEARVWNCTSGYAKPYPKPAVLLSRLTTSLRSTQVPKVALVLPRTAADSGIRPRRSGQKRAGEQSSR